MRQAHLWSFLPENRDQLATRSDIDRLGQILGQRIEGVEQNMERFETRLWDFHEALRAQTRIYITAMLGSMVGVAGIAFAAAALV